MAWILHFLSSVGLIIYAFKKGAASEMNQHLSKKRLLVIDDDPSVLFAIRKLLFKKNILIDTSESLNQAMQFIDKHDYQLIITDLGFSESVDNAGIVISCYAREKNPHVKIILWTGRDVSHLYEKIQNANINLCLLKPIAPSTIFKIVEDVYAS